MGDQESQEPKKSNLDAPLQIAQKCNQILTPNTFSLFWQKHQPHLSCVVTSIQGSVLSMLHSL